MNEYRQLQNKHQKDINAFLHKHAFFAFSKEQFNVGVDRFRKSGKLDDRPLNEQIFKFGSGGYMLKSERGAWHKLGAAITEEQHAAMAGDPDGTGYNFQCWDYELPNYEFSYSWDLDDVFLNYGARTIDFWEYPGYYKGLVKAIRKHAPNFPISQYDFLDIEKLNTGEAAPVLPERPLFAAGTVCATPAVMAAYKPGETAIMLYKHLTGDYGDLPACDREANKEALKSGARILSAYPGHAGRVWIITEADRSATTILFPSEY